MTIKEQGERLRADFTLLSQVVGRAWIPDGNGRAAVGDALHRLHVGVDAAATLLENAIEPTEE